MDLFDLIKMMYGRKGEYEKVSNDTKAKNAFMINRLHGIQYPIPANMLNRVKVNGAAVVDYWQRQLSGQYRGVPSFMYAKGAKAAKKDAKVYTPTDEVMSYYARRFNCSFREINEARALFGDEFDSELKEYEKLFADARK